MNLWNELFTDGMWGFGDGSYGAGLGSASTPEKYEIEDIFPLYANGEAVATYTETNYFASDTLGSVKVVTGSTGSITGYANYDVFGKPYERAGTLAREDLMYAYTGKTWDAATGLSNYDFRDYAPQLARFTTVDPIRDGNNWYAYVPSKTERLAADPANLRDLWGLTASDSGSINFPIRSGDVLSQITKDHNYRYGTDYTAEEIALMNGIANSDLIYAGNSLKLPVPSTSPYASSVSENKKEVLLSL